MKSEYWLSLELQQETVQKLLKKYQTKKQFLSSISGTENEVSRSALYKMLNPAHSSGLQTTIRVLRALEITNYEIRDNLVTLIQKECGLTLAELKDFLTRQYNVEKLNIYYQHEYSGVEKLIITDHDPILEISANELISLLKLSEDYHRGIFCSSWLSRFQSYFGSQRGIDIYNLVQNLPIPAKELSSKELQNHTKALIYAEGFSLGSHLDQ